MNRAILTGLLVCAVPGASFAQTADIPDRRVTLGLTIPFGNAANRTETEPRMELRFDHRYYGQREFDKVDLKLRPVRQSMRMGVTLSEDHAFMLNGREMPKTANRSNLSTAAWIGIGAVVLIGGGALILYKVADDASE